MRKWMVTCTAALTLLCSSFAFQAEARSERYVSKPKLTFPVISDIHVQSWDSRSHDKFKAALQDLHRINPKADAMVINGDLTDGKIADYTKLKELLKEVPHPGNMFYTIGNHEFYQAWTNADGKWSPDTFPNGITDRESITRFLQFAKQPKVYYEKKVKGYSFLFLGSEQYRQSNPDNLEDAYLSDEQLSWLDHMLENRSKNKKPVFVFLHQPLPDTVSGTSFCCVNNRAIIQHEALKKILSKYSEVFFFSGHTHWELKLPRTLVRDTFTMINSSSVYQLWTENNAGGETMVDPKESEGLYVEVFEDHVSIKGRDFYRNRWIPEAQFSVPIARK